MVVRQDHGVERADAVCRVPPQHRLAERLTDVDLHVVEPSGEEGYYGQFGEFCLPCPAGAECKAEFSDLNRTFSEPESQSGWWRMEPELGSPDARVAPQDVDRSAPRRLKASLEDILEQAEML